MRPSALLLTLALCTATAGAPARLRAQDATAADSAAAAAARQLDVGEQWFKAACLECHASGNLTNPDFRLAWRGKSAFELFERIRSTMPQNKPGTLSQGTYASIVAYLMKVNGLAVGTRRLTSDSTALASIRLTFPAGSSATDR
jgi:S-disulfanyl-L-cysteine oxidoreductase SoxD